MLDLLPQNQSSVHQGENLFPARLIRNFNPVKPTLIIASDNLDLWQKCLRDRYALITTGLQQAILFLITNSGVVNNNLKVILYPDWL